MLADFVVIRFVLHFASSGLQIVLPFFGIQMPVLLLVLRNLISGIKKVAVVVYCITICITIYYYILSLSSTIKKIVIPIVLPPLLGEKMVIQNVNGKHNHSITNRITNYSKMWGI